MTRIADLMAEKARLLSEANTLNEKPDATAEERKRVVECLDKADAITRQIEERSATERRLSEHAAMPQAPAPDIRRTISDPNRQERMGMQFDPNAEGPATQAELRAFVRAKNTRGKFANPIPEQRYEYLRRHHMAAFEIWCAAGMDGVARAGLDGFITRTGLPTTTNIARQGDVDEYRNFLTSPGSAGGILVSPLIMESVIGAERQALGPIEAGCTVVRTATGAPLAVPLNDDTGARSTIQGEAAAAPSATSAFATKEIRTYKYTTGEMRATFEMLQDAYINIPEWISSLASGRMLRALAEDFVTGNGTSAPEGLLTAIDTIGANAYQNSATNNAFAVGDILPLLFSVDPVIRDNPRSAFMGSDQVKREIMAFVDETNSNRSLFVDNRNSDQPTIYGKRYVTLTNMTRVAIASNQTRLLYGDISAYYFRETMGLILLRNDYIAMGSGQVNFYGLARYGGAYINPAASATTQPIKGLRIT